MELKLQHLNFKGIHKSLLHKMNTLTGVGLLAVSSTLSGAVMAIILAASTSYHTPSDAHMLPYEEAEAPSVNVRDALVEVWKHLKEGETAQAGNMLEADSAEVAEVQTPKEPETVYPFDEKLTVKVKSGDTMAEILQEHHIGINDTNAIIKAMKKHYNPRNLRVGQEFELEITHLEADKAKLKNMDIKTGKLTRVEVKSEGESFTAASVEVPTDKQLARAGGIVSSSFYEAGDDAGIPAPVIVEMTQAFSYDIDFQRDIKPGQELEVLFEQLVSKEDGEIVGHGDLKYAAFKKTSGKKMEVFKFTDKQGNSGYYKPNGESVRKALLKTPVKARISSKYGMRKHPILGYSKMHTGIDFAARSGTPIYAAGDGKINYAGRKGGYGNYIKIKHSNGYETAYAHMRKFAKGMRNGKRVKQGQVIGYVGSTGRSTGPHLHYEILKAGRHINPAGAKFRTGHVLKGTELANFKREQSRLKNQLASLPRIVERVAQANILKQDNETNSRN